MSNFRSSGHPLMGGDSFGDNVALEIEAAFEHLGDTIVRFNVDGVTDKANLPRPIDLTYYFYVQDQRIAQIIILHNKAIAAGAALGVGCNLGIDKGLRRFMGNELAGRVALVTGA